MEDLEEKAASILEAKEEEAVTTACAAATEVGFGLAVVRVSQRETSARSWTGVSAMEVRRRIFMGE